MSFKRLSLSAFLLCSASFGQIGPVTPSSGGGAPSGAAGGYLSGTYPNPSIKYQWQSSGNTGVGPTSFTPTHTLDCYDATATTGDTSCVFRAGAGQSGNLVRIYAADGTTLLANVAANGSIFSAVGFVTNDGGFTINGAGAYFGAEYRVASGGMGVTFSDGICCFNTNISRISTGIVGIGNGTAGDFSGAIKLASVNTAPTPTTQSGTAGTASCSTGLQGTQKYTTCYLAAYANTSTAQTYAFPVAFATTPVLQISGGSCGTFNPTASASTLTLPANAAMTAESCNISVLGQ